MGSRVALTHWALGALFVLVLSLDGWGCADEPQRAWSCIPPSAPVALRAEFARSLTRAGYGHVSICAVTCGCSASLYGWGPW